ncbi:MAG: SRPBCC family protein [Solirubrobacterales bacterium]|nr:SRPBCC family protein [Solirubrobacterales bacterium]
MGPVYAELDIDAPREEIFEYLMDFDSRPYLYGDSVRNFRLLRLDSRGVGAGARWQFKRKKAWADSAIVAADPPRRISERGATGSYNKNLTGTEWEMEETSTGVTRVRITFWIVPSGFSKVHNRLTGGARWHRRRLAKAGQRLRDAVESGRAEKVEVPVAGGNRHATGVA